MADVAHGAVSRAASNGLEEFASSPGSRDWGRGYQGVGG